MEELDAIRRLRSEVEDAEREFTYVDYDAGTPADDLNSEDQKEGRQINTEIAEMLYATSPEQYCRPLFNVVRTTKPDNVLEMGTCIGVSAAYQAAALYLNEGGELVTIEGSEVLASISRENLNSLGLENATVRRGRFQNMLQRN